MDNNSRAGVNLDTNTEAQLVIIEGNLNKTLVDALDKIMGKIDSQFDKMETSIHNFFNKDIEYLKEQNQTWKKQHGEHFEEVKEVRKEIIAAKESVMKDVQLLFFPLQEAVRNLEKIQSKGEGHETGIAKAQKSFMDKYGAWMVGITLLLGIAGWLYSVIF